VNGATGGVEPAPATKSRPGWQRRVERLLLDIVLGLHDVMYYFSLLSILPASTTVTPVSFPGTVRYIVHRHPWYVRAREKLKRRRRSRLDMLVPAGVAAALLLPLLKPSDFLKARPPTCRSIVFSSWRRLLCFHPLDGIVTVSLRYRYGIFTVEHHFVRS
jgi:hypothetical protein